ncbi:MAG TPA: DUF3592 domain-containing protein [Caulobacteraceae bacterium]|nr:DUF3592 domain-containing protein [Caulobacteraceae bacterium]
MGSIVIAVAVAVVAIAWIFHLRSRAKAKSSAAWPTAAGAVVACDLVHKVETDAEGESEDVWYAKPTYSYAVGGRTLTGSRVAFGAPERFLAEKQAQAIVARYPAGSAVQVRYNPQNPSECVLESKAPSMVFPIIATVAGLILALVGAALMA